MNFSKKIFIVLKILGLSLFIWGTRYLVGYNQAEQARFNIDVLDQYIQSYRLVEGKQIESLDQIPDFEIISEQKSLSARSAVIKKKIAGGYIYDMQSFGGGKYIISASPIGLLSPQVEFAVMENGLLYRNTVSVDADPDSREETASWALIVRETGIRTKVAP